MKKSVSDLERGVDINIAYGNYFGNADNALLLAGVVTDFVKSKEDSQIEDWGGGTGVLVETVLKQLDQASETGLVIDLNTLATATAEQKGLRTENTDLLEIDRPESADIILMRSVLHYSPLDQQIAILENIIKTLRPGGRVFHLPAIPGDGSPLSINTQSQILNDRHLGRVNIDKNEALHYITPEEHIKNMQKAGFHNIKIRSYAPPLIWTPKSAYIRANDSIKQPNADLKKFLLSVRKIIDETKSRTVLKTIGIQATGNIRDWELDTNYPIIEGSKA